MQEHKETEFLSDEDKSLFISFLSEISKKIEQNSLSKDEIQKLSEFYTQWKFSEEQSVYTDKEYLKFMATGWYIHKSLK